MQVISAQSFSWLGETFTTEENGLNFYYRCKLDKNEFEVGAGATLIYNNKLYIGCVHYLYENTHKTSPVDKFRVVIELFYSPKDLDGLIKNSVDLDADIEIIKQEKIDLKHLSIDCLKAPCLIAYGLVEEEPCVLMQEFAESTKNAIYICRYLAALKNGQYTLKGTVINQIEISDDEEDAITVKQESNEIIEVGNEKEDTNNHTVISKSTPRLYSVTDVVNTEKNIKLSVRQASVNKSKTTSLDITRSGNTQNVVQNIQNSSPTMNTTPIKNRKYHITLPESYNSLKLKFVRKKVKIDTNSGVGAVPVVDKNNSLNSAVSSKKHSEISPITLFNNLTISDSLKTNTEISPSSLIKSISLHDNSPDKIARTALIIDKQTSEIMRKAPQKMLNKRRITFYDEVGKENTMLQSKNTPIVLLEKMDANVPKLMKIEESPVEMENLSPLRISTRRRSQKQLEQSTTPLRISTGRRSQKELEQSTTPIRKSQRHTPRKCYNEKDVSPVRRSTRQKNVKNYEDYERDETPSRSVTPKLRKDHSPAKSVPPVKEVIVKSIRNRSKRTSVTAEETMMMTPKKQSKIVQTPKSTKILVRNMTPAIEARDEMLETCGTPMQRARAGLSFYKLPAKTPCRENEYMNICTFVSGRLRDETSGCMYISGVPGTGKTMTVCKVMKDLSEEYDKFVFLKLNALSLTEPRQIYVEIIKKLKNKTLHWEQALDEMVRYFKSKPKKMAHVILIDELDKLCNRKQDVVYNLLDLPFHSATALIVITIANTMDLPERILTNKVNSRLGLVRLTFKPYQYKDLVKIVTERLSNNKVFKNEALELVARKVAAVSGDARRALAMCSRATEVAEEEEKELITMEIVDRVVNEMISSSKVKAVKCCSKSEQLILSSMSNEVMRTGNEEVPFRNLFQSLEKLCYLETVEVPSIGQCLRLCHHLGSFRLLIIQHGRMDINMTLMLNISPDDIHFALR